MAELLPVCAIKIEGKNGGGEGTTPVMERTQRLGSGNVNDHRLWRMANGECSIGMFLYFFVD